MIEILIGLFIFVLCVYVFDYLQINFEDLVGTVIGICFMSIIFWLIGKGVLLFI